MESQKVKGERVGGCRELGMDRGTEGGRRGGREGEGGRRGERGRRGKEGREREKEEGGEGEREKGERERQLATQSGGHMRYRAPLPRQTALCWPQGPMMEWRGSGRQRESSSPRWSNTRDPSLPSSGTQRAPTSSLEGWTR